MLHPKRFLTGLAHRYWQQQYTVWYGGLCVCLRQKCILFLGIVFSGGRRFFFALSAAGQARGPSVYCDAMHVWIPAEFRGGAPSIQRRLAGSFGQGVVFLLAEAIRCMENPTLFSFCVKSTPFRSHIVLFAPLSRPLRDVISPACFYPLCCLLRRSSTYSQQHSNRSNNTSLEHHCCCCASRTEHVTHLARQNDSLCLSTWEIAT